MHFFLYEILARAFAIYLLVDCVRTLWSGLAERKIRYFDNGLLDVLFDWSEHLVSWDAAPVSYWTTVCAQAVAAVACLAVAIFGWFPST